VLVGGVELGCALVGVQGIIRLVIARLILPGVSVILTHRRTRVIEDIITKVPKSYQTSDMYGFNLIARE